MDCDCTIDAELRSEISALLTPPSPAQVDKYLDEQIKSSNRHCYGIKIKQNGEFGKGKANTHVTPTFFKFPSVVSALANAIYNLLFDLQVSTLTWASKKESFFSRTKCLWVFNILPTRSRILPFFDEKYYLLLLGLFSYRLSVFIVLLQLGCRLIV